MKKRKLAAGIAAAALVAVLSISAVYAGNQGKSVSALWGEILKQSADEENFFTKESHKFFLSSTIVSQNKCQNPA